MKSKFLLAVYFVAALVHAQEIVAPEAVYPVLPTEGNTASAFVPAGWLIEQQVIGDLNRDGLDDFALLLHENSYENIVKVGAGSIDTNPRRIVVGLNKDNKGYSLILDNHTLIPRHKDLQFDDVINGVGVGGIKIDRGVLRVNMSIFALESSEARNISYGFRWQNGHFLLIGYDSFSRNRASGNTMEVSINYLTKKAKLSCGNFIREGGGSVKWKKIPKTEMQTIDSIKNSLMFSPLGSDIYCAVEETRKS